MGSGQSSDKLHCNRFLDGNGPPPLVQQARDGINGLHGGLNGFQPEGQMTWVILHRELPRFPDDNTLQINYIFPDGIQTSCGRMGNSVILEQLMVHAAGGDVFGLSEDKHPHPQQPYAGRRICAYLPDNREGRSVLKLLEKAFNEQLLFTVATNKDGEDVVTTASIPLKTQPDGGIAVDGYPDSDYLKTVRKLLKDKGIE